jgi:PleD family two-component response regulator
LGAAKGQGTGLGLSISNNIVGNHGGKIQVRSIEGIGTEFTFCYPNSGHSISVTSKNSINQYKRVTIIDFNQKNANHLSEYLKKTRQPVRDPAWGEELIAQGNMFNSDLVVLDASHPGLIDFARTINYLKKNYPSIAILLSSAGLIRHEFEEYIRQADGIIYKPYTEEEVIKVLAQISSKHTRADTDIKIDV